MDKDRKLINDLAKDQAKHKSKADALWRKSHTRGISRKKAEKYRAGAKKEYTIAGSIGTAQANLPNITRNTNVVIASNNKNNKILSGNKASVLSPKGVVKIDKKSNKKK